MIRAVLAFAFFAAILSPLPSEAGGKRGGDADRATSTADVRVTREAALATARTLGLVEVRETKLRRGRWEIEGWTSDRRRIEVEIDASTGAVLKQEFYGR